jgi:predicted dehydrogenase
VLCEKPLTRTSEEAKELIEIATSRGLILMVGHVFMFNPRVLFLKAEIDRGELGRIYYLDLVRTNLGPIRQDVGAIYDLASHDISICNFLLESQPSEVACNAAYYLQRDREDVALLTLYYPNQVVANIHVSWLDPRKVRQVTVFGNSKMALWDDIKTTEPLRLYDKGVEILVRLRDHGATFLEVEVEMTARASGVPSAARVRVMCNTLLGLLQLWSEWRSEKERAL